ncbi:hypothetical protein RHOSPDRAFT_31820 [Rhodotorula sp. JG-1b]|nr:hypothetical protein RHOSPDRAFT_31820 [Rhodotorula sp. JG-1b]
MAAAVMRAMTFGASSSSSSSDPTNSTRGRDGTSSSASASSRSRSRSSSKARSGKGGDGAADEDEGGAALSRSSSILCNYAPEGQRPPSILLNPLGPALSRSPPLSPSHAPISTTLPSGAADEYVEFDDLQSPTPRPGYTRSTSTSSLGSYTVPLSPGQGGFPTEAALLAARDASSPKAVATSPTRPPNIQRTSKIRFAPLPEIRPRAYSTGRNVWIVEEDDPDVAGGRRQRLVRVEGEGEYGDDDDQDYGGDADFAQFDDDHALGQTAHSPSSSLSMKFGSWSEALGLSPSASRRSTDEDGLSLSSSVSRSDDGLSTSVGSVGSGGSSKKLLKAFGLGGKSAKSAAKRSSGTRDKENRDDSLSRTSSGDSHASAGRRASLADASRLPKPQGTTGIPMRKSSTWEVGDVASPTGPEFAASAGGPVYYASPARTARKRAQYPPVAQRRNGRGRKQHVEVEEPAFEEWGAVGVGSQSSKRVVVGSAPASGLDDDDDGTGMAWLRKRRLQREQEQREREAAALAQVEEDRTDEPASVVVPEPVSAAVEDDQDTLTKDPRQLGSRKEAAEEEDNKRMPLPFLIRTPPSRSGTVDSTISTASTVRPASPTHGAGAAKPSGLSATRPILPPTVQLADEPEREDSSSSSDDDEEDGAPAVGAAARTTEEEDETALESESGESDSESDDDDLDEEELAHEEALAEEARRMAKSMGAERYHSARHENQLKDLDT